MQDEEFEEDEGIYDELNLEEEEEKFGLVMDDDESNSSDDTSEGPHSSVLTLGARLKDHRQNNPAR